jgi:hypothetical protein
MPADHDQLTRVESACAELAATGQPITFSEVATRAQVGRTTLYRRTDLRGIVGEPRAQGQDATLLSSVAIQLGQFHHSLEAIAAKVRRLGRFAPPRPGNSPQAACCGSAQSPSH